MSAKLRPHPQHLQGFADTFGRVFLHTNKEIQYCLNRMFLRRTNNDTKTSGRGSGKGGKSSIFFYLPPFANKSADRKLFYAFLQVEVCDIWRWIGCCIGFPGDMVENIEDMNTNLQQQYTMECSRGFLQLRMIQQIFVFLGKFKNRHSLGRNAHKPLTSPPTFSDIALTKSRCF